jgi:outer membrane protein assembly factor BamB
MLEEWQFRKVQGEIMVSRFGRHGIFADLFPIVVSLPTILIGWQMSRGDDWPQWLGPKRDGVWREMGIIEKFPKAGPKVLWRTPIGGGYSGPAVAGDQIFVTDRVLAADAKNPASGFNKDQIPGKERVLCLDDATGKIIWEHAYDCTYDVQYPSGPRTTPVVAEGKVYTLGTMGDLLCLNVADGKVEWSRNLMKEYQAPAQIWGFSAHPLLDGDKLICLVGGEGSLVVAFHKDTGKELWKSLSASHAGYCPPMIFEAGGKRQLIIWHPQAIVSLDPESGKEYWSQKFEVKADLTIPTPRKDGDRLFISSFYNGSMMLKLDSSKPAATVLWKGKAQSEMPKLTDGLHSIISTPYFRGDYIYGVCSYGELRGLRADTGERLWQTFQATTGAGEERWSNAFIVPQGDHFFLFNEHGNLIIARLTPRGYEEISRAHLLEPTNMMVTMQRPKDHPAVLWSHPAFAHRSVYARNDKEIIRVSLAAADVSGR